MFFVYPVHPAACDPAYPVMSYLLIDDAGRTMSTV